MKKAPFSIFLASLLAISALSVMVPYRNAVAGTFPGDNGKIAFTSYRDGNQEIYVMNADGSGQTNLSNNGATDTDASWSPDGRKIAFISDRSGSVQIYVMNADGSGQTKLTNTVADNISPSWSPDGTKIAFVSLRDGNFEIYVMNADGSGQTNLSNEGAADIFPSWSPDGTKIAFANNRDVFFSFLPEIYVMNADGSGQTRLTDNVVPDSRPSWSPDGSKIAFDTAREPGVENVEIFVMNADGSGQTNLTNNPSFDLAPSWSPDGSKIAYASESEGNREIFVMNADGSGQTNVTNNAAADDWPDWQTLPNVCSNENGLLADAGVIGIGGTTELTQKIDTCGGLTGVIQSWTVLESDGDSCIASGLPVIIPTSGEVTKEYPTDFSIAIPAGDGECDTGDTGVYESETQVEIDGITKIFVREFETIFFVIPESPIGAAALIATSLATLGAVMYLKRH